MEYAIRTEGLSKHFGAVRAVEGVSLRVARGEIYGFLGLNGAGKTTTIRMLLGMVRPSSGAAFIEGARVGPGATRLWARCGAMVEAPNAYPELSVRENLELMRRLRGVPDRRAVDAVIERLKLGEYRDRKAGKLSLGNAQRLGLAKALLHEPAILILDEPANGLDPTGIVEIRELLTELARERGTSILVSSHILGEIARFASKIGIIHQGRLLEERDPRSFDDARSRRLLLRVKDSAAGMAALRARGYEPTLLEDGSLELREPRALEAPEALATLLVEAGAPPSLLKPEEEDLEAYFLRAIGAKGASL